MNANKLRLYGLSGLFLVVHAMHCVNLGIVIPGAFLTCTTTGPITKKTKLNHSEYRQDVKDSPGHELVVQVYSKTGIAASIRHNNNVVLTFDKIASQTIYNDLMK